MLKITVEEKAKRVTLRLEGRITGSWVAELNRAWQSLTPSLDSKKLSLDLREVTHIDTAGQRLLAKIYNQTGNEFLTGSLMMEFYAQEAMREHHRNEEKGA